MKSDPYHHCYTNQHHRNFGSSPKSMEDRQTLLEELRKQHKVKPPVPLNIPQTTSKVYHAIATLAFKVFLSIVSSHKSHHQEKTNLHHRNHHVPLFFTFTISVEQPHEHKDTENLVAQVLKYHNQPNTSSLTMLEALVVLTGPTNLTRLDVTFLLRSSPSFTSPLKILKIRLLFLLLCIILFLSHFHLQNPFLNP